MKFGAYSYLAHLIPHAKFHTSVCNSFRVMKGSKVALNGSCNITLVRLVANFFFFYLGLTRSRVFRSVYCGTIPDLSKIIRKRKQSVYVN